MNCFDANAPEQCICYGPQTDGCVCEPAERTLRAYIAGAPMAQMTRAQREACLEEIHQVEGYDRKDYEAENDAMLARGVIAAWTDYCRDKGLL